MAAEMPERIWACQMGDHITVKFGGWWSEPNAQAATEYVLASTHQRVIEALREAENALEQARSYVERDEVAHGRPFGTGNAIRAALAAIKEHTP